MVVTFDPTLDRSHLWLLLLTLPLIGHTCVCYFDPTLDRSHLCLLLLTLL